MGRGAAQFGAAEFASGENVMGKEQDYRDNAGEALKLAAKLPATAAKKRLLNMAEKWLDLADQAHRHQRRHTVELPEHPLLRAKLGPDHSP
jgi:hypothetical protein